MNILVGKVLKKMGMGDDLMYLGEAYKVHKQTGKKIKPIKDGRYRVDTNKQPAFQNIDWFDVDGYPLEQRPNGKRWYHDVDEYKPIPAQINLTAQEEAIAHNTISTHGHYVIVNPDAKSGKHHAENKHWPRQYWIDLCNLLTASNYTVIRCRPPGASELPGAIDVTTNVREMFALIKHADHVFTTDGLAHHTAAAFNTPCTVIWGHCTSPRHLGYEYQTDLVTDIEGAPCYTIHKNCPQCKEAMQKITPIKVLDTVS